MEGAQCGEGDQGGEGDLRGEGAQTGDEDQSGKEAQIEFACQFHKEIKGSEPPQQHDTFEWQSSSLLLSVRISQIWNAIVMKIAISEWSVV